MNRPLLSRIAILTLLAGIAATAGADPKDPRANFPESVSEYNGEFNFARIRYTSWGDDSRFQYFGRWAIDYPESDQHFSLRLSELTTIKVGRDEYGEFKPAVLRLTDDALFDYPFVYMLEPGQLVFQESEIEPFREYLLRGGFLMVDDFWGEAEWKNWEVQLARVFPPDEYPVVDLPLTHPIFHIVFDLKEKPQVPAAYHWMQTHTTYERLDAKEPHYRGLFDDKGRLMIIMCHNTDLGDGWEREGENVEYFQQFSAKWAYPMGINIVVYALTH